MYSIEIHHDLVLIPSPSSAPRFFFLRSAMNGKVVDIRGGSADPGAKVIMYEQGDGYSDNQLWYEDKYGVIRSKLNDLVMDSSGKNISEIIIKTNHLNKDPKYVKLMI